MEDYLRLLAAQAHSILAWTIARERFGSQYVHLSEAQAKETDRLVQEMVHRFYCAWAPDEIKKLNAPLPPPSQWPGQ